MDPPVAILPMRRLARFSVAIAIAAAVFAAAAGAAIGARRWSGEVANAAFWLPWVIAIAVVTWGAPRWRPPWRSAVGAWRSPTNLAALGVALIGVAWLYWAQLERAMAYGVHAPPMTLDVLRGVIIGPFIEEWLFRGVLWRALVPEYPARIPIALVATTATAIAFAFWHLPFNPDAPLVGHAIVGALLALVRWRFDNLAPGFTLHVAINALYFTV